MVETFSLLPTYSFESWTASVLYEYALDWIIDGETKEGLLCYAERRQGL